MRSSPVATAPEIALLLENGDDAIVCPCQRAHDAFGMVVVERADRKVDRA